MKNLDDNHEFTSFDGGISCSGKLVAISSKTELNSCYIGESERITRGTGLSFAAASFGKSITSLQLSGLNRILVLDPQAQTVTVEAGISVGELLEFLLSHGFYLPVVPGYPTISIGGCIAADVHGKNQLKNGNFANLIESFTLYHPSCGELTASRLENSEIFELTIGGFGLTGTIVNVTLKVEIAIARTFDSSVEPVSDIRLLPSLLRSKAHKADFLVSWHDFNQTGTRFGSGFIEFGNFSSTSGSKIIYDPKTIQYVLPVKRHRPKLSQLTINPGDRVSLSPPILNNFVTVGAMNSAYCFVQNLRVGSVKTLSIESCYFPNKTARDLYFRAFGRAGFCESQVLLPVERFDEYIEMVKWWLSWNDLPITMASAKLFGGKSRYLRFAGEGICFALDFPRCANGTRFLSFIDSTIVKLGAIPNILKDSRLPLSVVAPCFPQYSVFRQQLRNFDPNRVFQSELSRRLDL